MPTQARRVPKRTQASAAAEQQRLGPNWSERGVASRTPGTCRE